ncbi:MAG: BREX system ATP-binding domain-containing protein [Methanomassiliicoccales archaeon]|jgi:hypothetical protein
MTDDRSEDGLSREMKPTELSQVVARRIIETLGNSGTPPEYGFQYFTEGIDPYLVVIDQEYFHSFIEVGGSAFKMVVGIYGGGKTHFLYCVRELGWKHDFISSYIVLSPDRTPFHKLELVYNEIVANLIYSQSPEQLLSGYDRGIQAVIERWYKDKVEEFSQGKPGDAITQDLLDYANSIGPYDSTSYKNALKHAFISLATKNDATFELMIQWLKGETPKMAEMKRYGVSEKIDKGMAFKAIRSVVQWVKEIGYSGLIVLLDEAEQSGSLTSKQKGQLYQNLRELIDECGHANFQGTMWFYAVPDVSFLEGRTLIYEALKQRLSTVFDPELNPTGVKIMLEGPGVDPRPPNEILVAIGEKLAKVYEVGYDVKLDPQILGPSLAEIAEAAYSKKLDTGYKRLFIQTAIRAFNTIKKTGKPVKPADVGL